MRTLADMWNAQGRLKEFMEDQGFKELADGSWVKPETGEDGKAYFVRYDGPSSVQEELDDIGKKLSEMAVTTLEGETIYLLKKIAMNPSILKNKEY